MLWILPGTDAPIVCWKCLILSLSRFCFLYFFHWFHLYYLFYLISPFFVLNSSCFIFFFEQFIYVYFFLLKWQIVYITTPCVFSTYIYLYSFIFFSFDMFCTYFLFSFRNLFYFIQPFLLKKMLHHIQYLFVTVCPCVENSTQKSLPASSTSAWCWHAPSRSGKPSTHIPTVL